MSMQIKIHKTNEDKENKFEDLSTDDQLDFLRKVEKSLVERGVPTDVSNYLVNKKLDYLYPNWFTGNPDMWDISAKLFSHWKHLENYGLRHEMEVLGYVL